MKKNNTQKDLFRSIKTLILEAQQLIVRNINTTLLLTYFETGRMIVENQQQGNYRAEYAKELLQKLSADLTKEFGKGYSVDTLERCRNFYLIYQHRISAPAVRKFTAATSTSISAPAVRKLKKSHSVIEKMEFPFPLNWSHYIELLKIKDEQERSFYEIEATEKNWSKAELIRQYNAALYERIALSRNKKGVKKLSQKGLILEKTTDALRNHYVLEFLGLKEEGKYTESDLETAIINKLEQFMLELGKGFLFEGRQRRFTFEGDSFYVDLVFYNRLLKCFVLFDLKIGKLTHQDIGQMQMYVNYYDRMVKTKTENATIGIVLCKEQNKTVIEFTLPEKNKQIFAREYKALLPTKAALAKQLE